MDKKEAKKLARAWQKEVTTAVAEIVSATITGKTIATTTIQAEIDIPEPLARAISTAAKKTGLDSQAVFKQIMSETFQSFLASKINPITNQEEEDDEETEEKRKLDQAAHGLSPMPPVDFNVQEITEQFEQLKSMLGMFKGMSEVMNNETVGNILSGSGDLGKILGNNK